MSAKYCTRVILLYLPKIGDAFSQGYESKLDELRDKFRRAKDGLRISINFGTWKRVMDAGELMPCIIRR